MIYYLLKNRETGEPMEMIGFKRGTDMEAVQVAIDKAVEYFIANDDDSGCLDGFTLEEYVVNGLIDLYDVQIVRWSNDDNLYY